MRTLAQWWLAARKRVLWRWLCIYCSAWSGPYRITCRRCQADPANRYPHS